MKYSIRPQILSKQIIQNAFILCRIFLVILFFGTNPATAQDILFKRDSIRCKIIKVTTNEYIIAYLDSTNTVIKTSIAKKLVDSVKYKQYPADSMLVKAADTNAIVVATAAAPTPAETPKKADRAFKFKYGISLNATYTSEVNPATGPGTKIFSSTSGIDLEFDYTKEGKKFQMTNEAHWLFGMQKPLLSDSSHIQNVTDDLKTLHDYSVGMADGNKLGFNIIAKTETSVFTIYNGGYFQDVTHTGKTKGFVNPYDVNLAPGIKYQPDKYLRVSVSPYSVDLYGLENQQIANTGLYTHDSDAHHNYTLFVFKQLGAEVNIWYDRTIGKWLEIQYRLGISSAYFDNIGKNGLIDGLFITKINLLKNLYISHNATLKGDLSQVSFKPDFSQTILLSYTKSL